MIAGGIRRALLRLAFRQALQRWQIGLWRWLALMAALWGALSLVAVTSELPRLLYYGLLMTLLGALPAFLAYPQGGEALVALVRSIDNEAALESYIWQEDGPARTLLAPRAELALRLALLDPPRRPRLHKAFLAVLAAGIALFALAQALSLRAGYGISLGYPEKGLLKPPERVEEAEPFPGYRPEFTLVPTEGGQGEAGREYARPSRGRSAGGGEAVQRSPLRRPGNEPAEPESAGAQDGDDEAGAGGGDKGAGGSEAGVTGDSDRDAEGPEPEGTARQFGYEGSGRALESSPLLDYRAVFEREYVARTGEESALGPNIAPALAQESIAAYYGSFSRDLVLSAPAEARLEELKAAWLRLGREGGAP